MGNVFHRWYSVIAKEHIIDNKKLLQLSVTENIKVEEVLRNTNFDVVASFDLKFYFKNNNLGLEIPFESIKHGSEIAMPSLPVSVTVKQRIEKDGVVALDTSFPIMANLPDMTCSDFIKSICQMYALFPYFDIKNSKLKFLQIDDIYDNVDKAKNWDDKVVSEPWSMERTFGDYAKKNLFRYAEDDTVRTVSQDYLVLEDSTLDAEKELVTLKFSATDMSGNLASLPIYASKEGGVAPEKPQSIKPRILSQGVIDVENGTESEIYKSLTFNSSMFFENKDIGLLDIYYGRYRDVVSKPVVRDVTVMLSEVELMNMSTLDIIYLRGKYWMPIKVQVGIDGKAQARLILLPNVFKQATPD